MLGVCAWLCVIIRFVRPPVMTKNVIRTLEFLTVAAGKKKTNKQTNKQMQSQINDMLESAGFSRSNPYYIVQQGKVQALVQMRAAERLALLEEVRHSIPNLEPTRTHNF